jgi:hypothetical protein
MLVDCRLMYTELGGQQSGVCRTRANLLRRLRSPQPGDGQKAGDQLSQPVLKAIETLTT